MGERKLRLLVLAVAVVAALSAFVSSAAAAPVGQITSFGGYGLGQGQFANPTMLGVDPADGSIYVADLTEKGAGAEGDREKYRIQKFSSSGTFEASLEIARWQDPPTDEKLIPLFGMAIDPTLHRLYLIEGGRIGAEEKSGNAYAKRILIFSTVPKEGKLVPPTEGPTSLPLPTGTEQLVLPKTLAVDPSTHDVEVMAQTPGTSGIHTVLQRVSSSGAIGARFVDTANKLRPAQEIGISMTVGPTGKTYVMTGRKDKAGTGHTKAWELPASLTEVTEVPGFAATAAAEEWPFGLTEEVISQVTNGPEIAISPDGSTLYWKELVEAASPAEGKAGNYLIHGFSLKEGATAQTYGGATSLTSCHVSTGNSQLGVSGSGANERVVVLDMGPLNEEVQTKPAYGGNVLVFGRGGSGCPAPTAKFKTNGVEEGAEVEAGKTVTFDASGSELASGPAATAGFRKELVWKFGDGTEQIVTGTGGGEASTTITHTYASGGTYTASLVIHLKKPTYGNPLVVEHKVVVKGGGGAPEEFLLTVTGHGSGSGFVTNTTPAPAGTLINCGSVCEHKFEKGTVVTLKGTSNAGSKAVTWENCDSINGSNECVVTMSAAKSVIATFNVIPKFTLKVTKSGNGTGTVTSTPAGISCGTECEASFEEGTSVTLKAASATGTKAAVWTGCDSVNGSNECLVSMTAAKSVTATFTLEQFNLKVTKGGTGSGTVTSEPAGISCGSTCEAVFNYGTAVALKGTQSAGSKAVVWSGCDSVNGSNECLVSITAAKSVTATFTLVPKFTLKVTKPGNGSGTVTSTPAGINCGPTCEAEYEEGTSVTLKAASTTGSKAAVWAGCDSVNGSNECVVSMTADKSVMATFTLETHVLKVSKSGSGSGAVVSTPTGINCGTECEAPFNHGTSVTLKGTPAAGSQAATWSGCDSVNGSNECVVSITAAKSVTATFALEQHTLKVTTEGNGTVTSSPAGINCGAECEASFVHGTAVTLKGAPGAGAKAVVWSGCDSVNGSNECLVNMTAAKAVTATFPAQGKNALGVTKAGNGSGTVVSTPTGINCGSDCSAEYTEGTAVTLKGTADSGSKAVVWTGCDSVNGSNECLVNMTAAKSVTATFTLEQHTLKVTKSGSGTGTVTSSPTGINCGTECEAAFNHGTSVTLKGTPAGGSEAAVWTGCDSVNGSNECLVTITAAKTVTASFAKAATPKFTLKVNKGGSGSGTVVSTPVGINCGSECEASFDQGTAVTLKGTADSGSQAVLWAGCDSVNGSNECLVSMTAAKTVLASFTKEGTTNPVDCSGSNVTGAGSTLQGPAQSQIWGPAYHALCPSLTVGYESLGSGAGLSAWGFNGSSFDKSKAFIGSDESPNAAQIKSANTASGSNVLVVPVAQTAIGVVVNPPAGCQIEEITNKQLESIMRGNIKIWNKIQTASGAGCVNAPITRVVRAEGSGTTFQLKTYLSMVNAGSLPCTVGGKTWRQLAEIGAGDKPNTVWPESGVAGCSAKELSPVVTASGGAGLVNKVDATEGGIGYAAIPDVEANKNGDTNWVKLQNNGVSNKLAIAQFAPPSIEGAVAARCESIQYAVPLAARVGQANPANVDWSQVSGAAPNIAGTSGNTDAYPLCTLTYDIALTNYSKAGLTEGQEKTVKSYLTEYVTAEAGQEALESGKRFYAPLPTSGVAKFDVLGAARLAGSKIGF